MLTVPMWSKVRTSNLMCMISGTVQTWPLTDLSPKPMPGHVRCPHTRGCTFAATSWVVYCVQSEASGRRNDYEGLDCADMEPMQVHHPPDPYTGLSNHAPSEGLDRSEHSGVISDLEIGDQPQVIQFSLISGVAKRRQRNVRKYNMFSTKGIYELFLRW